MISALVLFSMIQVGMLAMQPVPVTQPSTWIQPQDFSEHVNGRTVAVLQIDSQGRIVSCTIQNSSGSDTLDKTVCQRAEEHARFLPARDDQGAAVSGSYLLPVLWGHPGIDIEPNQNRLVLTLNDGKAVSCANYDQSGTMRSAPSNNCHMPADLLTRYFGKDYRYADRLIITTVTISGSGKIPRAAPDGRRIILKESAVTIADDGTPLTCEARVAPKDQKGSLQDCVGYEAGRPFTGLKKFVRATDWTLHFPNTSGDAPMNR